MQVGHGTGAFEGHTIAEHVKSPATKIMGRFGRSDTPPTRRAGLPGVRLLVCSRTHPRGKSLNNGGDCFEDSCRSCMPQVYRKDDPAVDGPKNG